MEKIYLTKKGYDELKERYDYLCGQGRAEMAEKIKVAREFGDLSENAEYDIAKNEQAFMEKEIKEIDDKLANAIIIAESELDNKTVSIGSTVKVLDVELDTKEEYKIVGSSEAEIAENKISNESPLGKALIGKKKNAVVDVETPDGIVKYKILSISVD